MKPERYREITEHFDFRHDGTARFLGINSRTSRRFASGEFPVPRPIGMLLELMYRTDTDPVKLLRWEGSLNEQKIRQLNMFRDENAS